MPLPTGISSKTAVTKPLAMASKKAGQTYRSSLLPEFMIRYSIALPLFHDDGGCMLSEPNRKWIFRTFGAVYGGRSSS